MKSVFWETTWANKNLGSISQAGMVNNLNDGMIRAVQVVTRDWISETVQAGWKICCHMFV